MQLFPEARRLERDTLLTLVDIKPGYQVLDIQAAGGYLSDKIHQTLAGLAQCICLEPCLELANRIHPVHRVCNDPIERMPGIASRSIHVALGLAGLHHSTAIPSTLAELQRVLTRGGQLALCDVSKHSKMAVWLNEYVHQNNPNGHQGMFLHPDEWKPLLSQAGFSELRVETKSVPWLFDSEYELIRFCKGLFNLQPNHSQIREAIFDYLDVYSQPGNHGVALDWELTYAWGIKAA